MAVRINVRDSHLTELAALRDVADSVFPTILKELIGQKRPVIKPSQLRSIISHALPGQLELAEVITRQLIFLSTYARHEECTADEIVTALNAGLRRVPEGKRWSQEELQRWDTRAKQLVPILSDHTIAAVAKTLDLSVNYSEVFREASIISDIRPVFDGGGNAIVGGIVSHLLKIHYHSSDDHRELQLVLSEDDLTKLKSACERALTKGKTLRDFLQTKCGLDAFTPGEDEDAN